MSYGEESALRADETSLEAPSDPSTPPSVASSAAKEQIAKSEISRIAAHVQDPGSITAREGGRLLLGRGGGGMHRGICGRMNTFRDGGWTVVVLSNYDPPVCEVLGRGVTAALARLPER